MASPVTRAQGTAGVAVAVVSWGFGPVLIKLADLPVLTLALYRLWLGFGVMFSVHLALRGRVSRRALRASAVGGLLFGVNIVVFFTAVKKTSVADASLITALQPALVLVVAGRWFGERVGRREVLLTALALSGVAVVITASSATPVWSLEGDLYAVAALFTFAGYFLVSKRVRDELDALEYMVGVMLTAAIVVTPVALLSGQPLGGIGTREWALLLLFVLVPGAGGHLLINWAHRYVDVTVSSLMIVAQPVLAMIAALVILDEPITLFQALGGLLVVAAIAGLALSQRAPVPVETG